MKLLLCSEGFHTANTVQACVELVGKPQNEITVAIINEAFATVPLALQLVFPRQR